MSDVPPDVQMANARSMMQGFIAISEFQRQNLGQFIKGLSKADVNGDGTVSGDEVATSMVSRGGFYPDAVADNFRKQGCNAENRQEVEEAAYMASYASQRRLHVLRNPTELTHGIDIVTAEATGKFATAMGMKVEELAPTVRSYLTDSIREWGVIFNRTMIGKHAEMADKGEIGVLPSQLLPATGAQLCRAMNSKEV